MVCGSWTIATVRQKLSKLNGKFPLVSRVSTNVSPASVAQLDAPSDWRPGGRGFNPSRGRQHSSVEIDHENIFYGHSPPSADSRRAVVSFWRKNVHNSG